MSDLDSEADYQHLQVLTRFRQGDRGGAGYTLSPQWVEALQKDPHLRQARITIDLVFGGDHLVRLATDLVVVTSATTGDVKVYLPQLMEEPEIEWSYTPGEGAAEVRSVSFTVHPELVKPKDIIARGRMLAGYGEVCLQLPGGDHDQRIVFLRGEMTGGIDFGSDKEEIEIELSDPKLTADLTVPPWITDTERFTSLPEEWSGFRFPIIFNGYTGVECIRVTDSTTSPNWLVCYGHGFTVDAVYVNSEARASGDAGTPWGQDDETDGLGTKYTEIDFSAGSYTWEEGDSVHADVTAGETLDLIGIIQALVEKFSVLGFQGSNPFMFSRARAKIPRLTPNVIIDGSSASDSSGVLTFIESTLLLSFPMISMGWEDGRYGPIVTDARRNLPVAELIAGQRPLIDRTAGPIETAKEDLLNYFTLQYGYDPISSSYTGVATRHPGNDAICRYSRDNVGARHDDTLESPFIRTAEQANYVIDWMVFHLALPSYYVEWIGFPWLFHVLKRGDLVWYTDPDFGWTAERATVKTLAYQRGQVTLGIQVWPGRKRLTTNRAD